MTTAEKREALEQLDVAEEELEPVLVLLEKLGERELAGNASELIGDIRATIRES